MSRRAVIAAPWFGVNSGGAEVALLKIAKTLSELEYDVEVFTTRSMAPYEDWLDNPEPPKGEFYYGLPVRRFPVDTRGFARYSAAMAALSQPDLMTQQQKEDFFSYGMTSTALVEAIAALPEDTLVIGGPYYQALIHSVVAATPGRVIVMPAFHEEPPFHFPAVSRLVQNARALLFLAPAEKEMAICHHGQGFDRAKLEMPVLRLPYVNDHVPTVPREAQISQKLLGDYLLYVGRMDEGKNITQLMNWHHTACEDRVRAGQPAVPLVMAGKGVDLSFESPFIKPIGRVSEAVKQDLICGALGVVNLSLNESFSFIIFEAWQQGIPVIVHSDCAVTRQHIEIGKSGYSCGNMEEYGSAISHFQNRELNSILGRNGREYADRICDVDGFRARLLAIIEASQ